MNYAVEQRLRFIDFLLAQYGRINRETVADYFGISIPSVSHDFKQYMTLAPGNMYYNKGLKTYVRSDKFQRKWG